jgi:hypothetical protein
MTEAALSLPIPNAPFNYDDVDAVCLCRDCGTDTAPCTGKRGCRHAGRWEYYMVTAEVWSAAGMPAPTIRGFGESDGDFLCVGCLETRLGRALVPGDFIKAPINEPSPRDTPRLASRKAGKAAGAQANLVGPERIAG